VTGQSLPYGRQEISTADVEAVAAAVGSELITQGPRVAEFERAFRDFTGAKHAVAFSSGTAALHAAATAAEWGAGDEVLVSPITFAASANCALYVGARPRFVDIDRTTWNIDLAAASRQGAEESVRGVVATSFAGLPVDLDALEVPAGVIVVEDGCHALGGSRDGRPVGGPGGADMTTFSFHPVKSMTTGEGGLVTTESEVLAERLLRFRTHGIPPERDPNNPEGPWFYDMVDLGFNYRITDIQCALGLSQLPRVTDWVEKRNELAATYRELLADQAEIELPPEAPPGFTHGRHLYPIRIARGAELRRRAFVGLREVGIGVQVHYIPIYRFSHYRETLGYPQDDCPEAERYYEGCISLPMYPGLEREHLERVAGALADQIGAPTGGRA
jgi:dTDP-4-amino-4,6-dideoxygalactose transaminase